MQQYSAIAGQSLLDVCLQTYGSLDYMTKLMQDNHIVNANAPVTTGEIFIWDDTLVQNQQVNVAFAQSGTFYATDLGATAAISGNAILTETLAFIETETLQTVITE